MMWFSALAIGCQLTVALAAPASNPNTVPWLLDYKRSGAVHEVREASRSKFLRAIVANANQPSAAVANGAAANAGTEAAGEGNEVENNVNGAFNQAIQLGGGNVKTDVLFTKSAVGALEVEFQNNVGRTLTVTENKAPAAPPAGFQALEPSSFQINLAEGAQGLTLQKVDYVLDVTNANVAAQDISQGQIGKLCTETNTFIIDPAIGELEFEAEENELSLTVDNMNGEWGIFIPQAGSGGNATNAGNAGNAGNAANAGGAPNGGTATDSEEGNETEAQGVFNAAIPVPGGNAKTDIQFTPSAAGNLEVEYNGTTANTVTVNQNANPAAPPVGMIFVDPTTFQIQTQSATNPATDTVKVDYIFTEAVKAAADVSQGTIGKLDPATNTFVTQGLGEFEFEEEEDEWSLTVPNLNGEWAILIPQSAANA
ncbi:hypothetical protein FQN54_003145 [Arachnomyces sp. PD_36]|nr:hypothetical protein FQN54_003145 [Arachnomyces sp. PD_36]